MWRCMKNSAGTMSSRSVTFFIDALQGTPSAVLLAIGALVLMVVIHATQVIGQCIAARLGGAP